MKINEVDKVEIITLQDNYIDITDMGAPPVIMRANPLDGLELKKSVLSEQIEDVHNEEVHNEDVETEESLQLLVSLSVLQFVELFISLL